MVRKLTTEDARSVDEVFQYNLENRLATHIKTTDVTASDELTIATTQYLYNHEGIKVRKSTEIVAENKATHEQTIVSQSSESYLIDAYNHTGYAQVLESVTDTGKVTSYTIGDDVLLQSTRHSLGDGGPITFDNQYFLPDGHGSTRQLTDSAGIITAQYSYDSYGLMLGQQSGNQQEQVTKLLYCGEQFDSSLQHYNLRARHYDPSNGRFNRLDPFAGSQFDPQSLHKYAYCHSDPVNNIDPSGMFLSSNFAYGNYVHGVIEADFMSKMSMLGMDHAVEKSISKIANYGALVRLFPDMVNISTKEVYDIGTLSEFSAKVSKVLIYVAGLNGITQGGWKPGYSYRWTNGPIVVTSGVVAYVFPTVLGVIAYQIIDYNKLNRMLFVATASYAVGIMSQLQLAGMLAAKGVV